VAVFRNWRTAILFFGGIAVKYFSIIFILIFASALFSQDGKLMGIVRDENTGEPLVGANVVLQKTRMGTVTDQDGEFVIERIKPGDYKLTITYIGYQDYTEKVTIEPSKVFKLSANLKETPIRGKEVVVVATRAIEGETPAAFATLTRKDIQNGYFAQDIPVMLSQLPSTTFYSENGNGIGYNYISIRGFDQRRISVLINGIPQNDPEDHNIYWIDFPDMLGNVEDIQVQRGAGNAFYGPPAIGGSVNIITSQFSQEKKISAFAGYGSYNTQKYSLSLNSGLLSDKFVIFGRLSRIKSDGYREQSWSDLKSYFVGAAWFAKNSTTRLHFYGGPIEDHLAYYGIPKEATESRDTRTANPIMRPDEIENFNQPHLELMNEYQLSKNLKLNNTLFGIRGYGFFDYDGSWAPLSYYRLTPEYGFEVSGDPEQIYVDDLLIRAYVDNKQAGWLPQLQYTHSKGNIIVGGEFRFHRSLHWGRIQKGSPDLPPAVSGPYQGLDYIGSRHYYGYKGAKDIISPYLHTTYKLRPNLLVMFDLQLAYNKYRLYDEAFIGTDFSLHYYFLNPRLGVNYKLNQNFNVFTSFSQTSREPRLKNFYDAAEASTPESWGAVTPQFEVKADGSYDFDQPLVKPETLNDIELGFGYQNASWKAHLNLFYMTFINEIIKKGQLDRFGQPVTGNADRTLHQGIEMDFQGYLSPNFILSGNFTYSENKLKKYSVFDSDGNEIVLDDNPIAGFPNTLANLKATYLFDRLMLSLSMQHVGKQYTDNFKNETNTVDSYTVFNAMVGYQILDLSGVSKIQLQLHIQNLFDTLYNRYGAGEEFFPAAERNAFINLKLDI
jgi:iron complex outermembrane receptor protein